MNHLVNVSKKHGILFFSDIENVEKLRDSPSVAYLGSGPALVLPDGKMVMNVEGSILYFNFSPMSAWASGWAKDTLKDVIRAGLTQEDRTAAILDVVRNRLDMLERGKYERSALLVKTKSGNVGYLMGRGIVPEEEFLIGAGIPDAEAYRLNFDEKFGAVVRTLFGEDSEAYVQYCTLMGFETPNPPEGSKQRTFEAVQLSLF
ncbi:hypothetical protein COY95_00565 [Candidatus Woesearchaeota archaeon CG_4_10_14_0_8_um_filter_47_5]|nr:MAG: hypothetical protein COY95_00565 [Candidatus Woesearchaeota archaeon CG_4_10_14_0_8_um_filter_47_5]